MSKVWFNIVCLEQKKKQKLFFYKSCHTSSSIEHIISERSRVRWSNTTFKNKPIL